MNSILDSSKFKSLRKEFLKDFNYDIASVNFSSKSPINDIAL
ncbi:hypothetical protein [Candidatus Borreliella tachyglossi]|nr:hypothetical protein [Candidatus Borreliella tachyglossi]